MKERAFRYCSAIICDDIRFEVSGQMTIVGIYGDALFLRQFPSQVPPLKIMINFVTPVDRPVKKFVLRFFRDSDLLHEHEIKHEELMSLGRGNEGDSKPRKDLVQVSRIQWFGELAAFDVMQRTALKIRLETEDEIIACGAIVIDQIAGSEK